MENKTTIHDFLKEMNTGENSASEEVTAYVNKAMSVGYLFFEMAEEKGLEFSDFANAIISVAANTNGLAVLAGEGIVAGAKFLIGVAHLEGWVTLPFSEEQIMENVEVARKESEANEEEEQHDDSFSSFLENLLGGG